MRMTESAMISPFNILSTSKLTNKILIISILMYYPSVTTNNILRFLSNSNTEKYICNKEKYNKHFLKC